MWGEGVFPFDLIKENDKIILYGMGVMGKSYMDQITRTHYCEIVAVSDKNSEVNCLGYEYVAPQNIKDKDFDYVVIAINSALTASDVFWSLNQMGVPKEKMVSSFSDKDIFFPSYVPEYVEAGAGENNGLKIAITFDGGIGDFVISLAFVRKLAEIAPTAQIDIFGKKWIADVIFGCEKNVVNIYDADTGRENPKKFKNRYDIAFRVLFIVIVEYCNYPKVKKCSNELYRKILLSINDIAIKDICFSYGNFLSIHQRAQKLGYDRYRFLGQGNIWNLSSVDSVLYLNLRYKTEFDRLNLGRYITFNYGASVVPGKEGMIQTKVWPREYFCQFIMDFKKQHPDIKIVQLGDKNSIEFQDADLTLLDQNLEVVKYVLANSLIHVDGEGGLVHVATQLGTKCVVLFGPTPVWFYGYPQNRNIVSPICENCCHLKPDWYTSCVLGDEKPRCMKSITPEMVTETVNDLLNSQ